MESSTSFPFPTRQINRSTQHRAACHRCGNIRKTTLNCTVCPYIFCKPCFAKMIFEHGDDIFIDGCPVCKDRCCCGTSRNSNCPRQYHCYKKCLMKRMPQHSKHGSESESSVDSEDEGDGESERCIRLPAVQSPKRDLPPTTTLVEADIAEIIERSIQRQNSHEELVRSLLERQIGVHPHDQNYPLQLGCLIHDGMQPNTSPVFVHNSLSETIDELPSLQSLLNASAIPFGGTIEASVQAQEHLLLNAFHEQVMRDNLVPQSATVGLSSSTSPRTGREHHDSTTSGPKPVDMCQEVQTHRTFVSKSEVRRRPPNLIRRKPKISNSQSHCVSVASTASQRWIPRRRAPGSSESSDSQQTKGSNETPVFATGADRGAGAGPGAFEATYSSDYDFYQSLEASYSVDHLDTTGLDRTQSIQQFDLSPLYNIKTTAHLIESHSSLSQDSSSAQETDDAAVAWHKGDSQNESEKLTCSINFNNSKKKRHRGDTDSLLPDPFIATSAPSHDSQRCYRSDAFTPQKFVTGAHDSPLTPASSDEILSWLASDCLNSPITFSDT